MSGDRAETTVLPGPLNRRPFNSPWVTKLVSRYALPLWFGVESILGIALALRDTTYTFFDARLYLAATRAWLDGGDPWQVHLAGNFYAAPPPSLLAMLPFVVLPPGLDVAAVALAVAVAAIATVRLLHLPWWWLLFPPLVQCVLSANIHGLLIPLMLVGGGTFAATAKIYAVIPLVILRRWRSLAGLLILLVATAIILPWADYIREFGVITQRLNAQTKLAVPAVALLALSPAVAVALVVVGRERAAWLAVCALWPSQQFYYGTLAMPAKSKIVGALMALPVPGNGLLALFTLAIVTLRRKRLDAVPRAAGP
jgi:hypothetical protein